MNRKREGPKAASCDPPGAAQRNRYFRGKLLTVADYTTEQSYHIERRRLINRALHDWGLIAGLGVERAEGGLRIGPGLAFDREGRELVACAETILERESDLLWLDEDTGPGPGDERPAGDYLLSAHYAERRIDGVRIEDGWGDEACEANRICETLVFSLARAMPSDGTEGAVGGDGDFNPRQTARLTRMGGIDVALDAPVTLARVGVELDPSRGFAFSGVDETYRPRRVPRPALAIAPEPPPPAKKRTGGGLKSVPVRVEVPARPAEGHDAPGDKE